MIFRIYLKRVFGGLTFTIGLAVLAWFCYNQIWPTEEFKTGFRSIFALAAPIACLVLGWKWMRYEGKGIHEVIPPGWKCPELDASIEKALATLGSFVSEVEKGIDGAFVKFPLLTPQGITEHIWAYVHFHRDGRFNVTLANEPVDDQVETDGRRDVDASEIEDWQIMTPEGQIVGAYSLRAMFEWWERDGRTLTPLMRKQKAQLLEER